MTRIRNALLEARSARGWSQARVADGCGISRQSYGAIESGASVPSTEVALRLAVLFGRAVETLFQLDDGSGDRVAARVAGPGVSIGARVRLARVRDERIVVRAEGVGRNNGPCSGIVVGLDGDRADIALLPDRPTEPSLVVMGCDPAFAVVAESMRAERRVDVLWSQLSSRSALEALSRGNAHVAGVHLRDPESGEFNRRWVRELVAVPCMVVSFASWEQGLLMAPGNPLGIQGVEDLVRPGVRYLNREPGSGSRALIDHRLAEAGVPVDRVVGYDTKCRGHLAAAEAVSSGAVDVAVGIEAAGRAFGLDTLPLATEPYQLVIPIHFADLPAVQVLIETLRRPGIRAQVEAFGGYDGAAMGAVTQ